MDNFKSNNPFWDVLEFDFKCKIPSFIKNILTYCNFGNVLSLQKFDNDDIVKIEHMVKGLFKDWLGEKTDPKNLVDYFGPIFYSKPEQFAFSCGDVKMIQQISEYVKSTVRTKGYTYFEGEGTRCPSNVKPCENSDATETEMQEKLFDAVSDLLEPYGKDVVCLFKLDMVKVTIDNGKIHGSVRCVLCEIENETQPNRSKSRKDYYSQYWNRHKWIISNFSNHHLRTAHPIHDDIGVRTKNRDCSEEMVVMKTTESTSSAKDLESKFNDGGVIVDSDVDEADQADSMIEFSEEDPVSEDEILQLEEQNGEDVSSEIAPNQDISIIHAESTDEQIETVNVEQGNSTATRSTKRNLANLEVASTTVESIPKKSDVQESLSKPKSPELNINAQEKDELPIESAPAQCESTVEHVDFIETAPKHNEIIEATQSNDQNDVPPTPVKADLKRQSHLRVATLMIQGTSRKLSMRRQRKAPDNSNKTSEKSNENVVEEVEAMLCSAVSV